MVYNNTPSAYAEAGGSCAGTAARAPGSRRCPSCHSPRRVIAHHSEVSAEQAFPRTVERHHAFTRSTNNSRQLAKSTALASTEYLSCEDSQRSTQRHRA